MMPRLNTKPPQQVQQTQLTPDYQLTMKMLTEFQQLWQKLFNESGVDAVLFSRLSVVALTQLGAVVAVDVGMTCDQFTDVCKSLFDRAYNEAPRFG